MNLHDIVRGAITAVHPDTAGVVYISTGTGVVRGIAQPTFKPVQAMLQVQERQHSGLQHDRGALYDSDTVEVWAYGNFDDLSRPDVSGGDIVNIGCQWHYITKVEEFWPDWCHFTMTRQLPASTVSELIQKIINSGIDPTNPAPNAAQANTQWTF